MLLSRKEVDMLYVTSEAVTSALEQLGVDYIVTGGSLLGAVRQHSILFCVDDIDIAIIERDMVLGHMSTYPTTSRASWDQNSHTPLGLGRGRPKHMSSIFLDLFTVRRYESMEQR